MPGKVKVRILAGRNLPVMDKSSDTSDAYVEVKLGNTTFKTDVCKKSLNPQWNSEWFKFEVDDEELQDEPLQIRIMDYDTYSANDAIGKVYIDLSPLLFSRTSGSVMSGWIPIFDTMHGIRGEVNVIVKVDLFSDFNRFRQSSCGVQFFCTPSIPFGYWAHAIHGFVEELVVNDDPEYQWIDKIRTPRASNEARQTLFSKLSGEVQRKIGLKALELGGNAVVGYCQCFDLEGDSGIVVRGIGTAVTLVRYSSETSQQTPSPSKESSRESPLPEEGFPINPGSPVSHTPNKLSQSPIKPTIPCVCRRSSDSDLNITPKSSSCGGSGTCIGGNRSARQTLPQESLEMLEYPFLSMTHFPPGFIIHIGGVVSTHSVKLLGRIHNPDEPETRDTWWTEIRMEIRSHARALGCNVVVGYRESTSICDDICVLSASGTAAIVCMAHSEADSARKEFNVATADRKDPERDKEKDRSARSDSLILSSLDKKRHASDGDDACSQVCSVCHIPYSESSIPFPITLTKCSICKKSKVPDVLFTTIELPPGVPVTGSACLIQARVCRMKKDAKGEVNAKEISDSLPFLEYELHRQLINKLKVKGMNALFGLKVQVSVGAKILVAVATATAMFLTPLPPPQVPKISSGKNALQDPELCLALKDSDCSDDDLPELDLSSGNKDTCVLEIDDADDVDIITLLVDPCPPDGFEIVNTEIVPGVDNLVCNLQMFSRVWRCKLHQGNVSCRQLSQIFENIIQSLFFKLRKMVPCVLCSVQFLVELPEDEELQVTVLGMVAGVGDFHASSSKTLITSKPSAFKSFSSLPDHDSELIFNMEEDHPELFPSHSGSKVNSKSKRFMSVEKKFSYHKLMKERFGIELSPLSYIPGGRIERYLGNLNFFFIRECTSIRENGGLSGFVQSFLAEVLAIVRSHVAALGGNAMISFFMNQCVLLHNPHKNQGQCLINVGGDAVQVLYPLELMAPQQTTATSLMCTSPVNVPVASHSDPNAAARRTLSRSPKEPKSSFVMGSQG